MSLAGYRCEACSAEFEPAGVTYVCASCGGNLDVVLDLAGVERESIESSADPSMWRYGSLLPVEVPGPEVGTMGTVGGTPLFRADAFAAELGVGRLWIKDEGRNPTGSLKDRASALVVQRARELGIAPIITASTGNAGVALAAMARAAGVEAVVLVPESAPAAKVAQLQIFGARLLLVRGSYDDAFRLSTQAAEALGWYCRNTGQNPFTVEGKKTVALEIAEQLGWRAPAWVVVSVGDGNILTGVHRGFRQLVELGWLASMPRLLGVQAEGSSPIAQAWVAGADDVAPVVAHTRADSISAGAPSDGRRALNAVRDTGGAYVSVSDEAILASIAHLGRGAAVFAEPAAAAAHAGLVAALADGTIGPDEEIVLLMTGTGLKDVDAAVQAAGVAPNVIDNTLAALREQLSAAKKA